MTRHCTPDPYTGHCAVCADEAREARVIELQSDGLALVEIGGERQQVALDLVADISIGDRVLIHAGVALSVVERHA